MRARVEKVEVLGWTKSVSVVHIILEILLKYEFLWYHGYLDHFILCSIHVINEVKIFDVHAHVSQFYFGYDAFLHAVSSWSSLT